MVKKLDGHNHVADTYCYAGCPGHPDFEGPVTQSMGDKASFSDEELAAMGYIKQPKIVAVHGTVIYDNGRSEDFSAYEAGGLNVHIGAAQPAASFSR